MLAGAAFGPGQAWESFDRCGPPPRRFMLRAQAALPPRQPAARLPPAPPSGAHTACNPTRAVGPGRAGRQLGPWAGSAWLRLAARPDLPKRSRTWTRSPPACASVPPPRRRALPRSSSAPQTTPLPRPASHRVSRHSVTSQWHSPLPPPPPLSGRSTTTTPPPPGASAAGRCRPGGIRADYRRPDAAGPPPGRPRASGAAGPSFRLQNASDRVRFVQARRLLTPPSGPSDAGSSRARRAAPLPRPPPHPRNTASCPSQSDSRLVDGPGAWAGGGPGSTSAAAHRAPAAALRQESPQDSGRLSVGPTLSLPESRTPAGPTHAGHAGPTSDPRRTHGSGAAESV
jgi:hypothetical protein